VLVAAALVLGYMLGRRRARLTGLDPQTCADGEVWIVVSGFVVAHWVSVLAYFPERVLERPWVLLFIWEGLSSFGGLFGAMLGAVIFFRRKQVSVIKYCDAIIFGFVPAWILGRMGCTVVFDHPGLPTDFVLGMHYHRSIEIAGVMYPKGTVLHNLGMYEAMVAVVLTVVLYAIKKIRPFDGFHPAVMLILYAPMRFFMDTLRVQDKTYAGLTPGHYFAIFMVLFAGFLIVNGLRRKRLDGAAGSDGAGPPVADAAASTGKVHSRRKGSKRK